MFAYCLPILRKGFDFGRWGIISCPSPMDIIISASFELGSEILSRRLEQISLRKGVSTWRVEARISSKPILQASSSPKTNNQQKYFWPCRMIDDDRWALYDRFFLYNWGLEKEGSLNLNDPKYSETSYEDHIWWAQIQTGPSGWSSWWRRSLCEGCMTSSFTDTSFLTRDIAVVIPPTVLALGSSAIVKVLGQTGMLLL